MAIERWVEHWLAIYCDPGAHDFRQGRPGVLACTRCGKEELMGGATCMICGIPGEHVAVLARVDRASPSVSGKLCGPCLDDFSSGAAIRGLRLETA
ncbi:MAG TPA: hypothetical protein VFY90_04710 [Tepidiformaceae bacterium]|nr:hypothetical protein [Tepidiformaceae bacterium]